MANETKTNKAWRNIFETHPEIMTTIEAGGIYELPASEIKKFREPRLMTKHDTWEGVPEPLRSRGINVLPVSRSSYVLGDFILHHWFENISHIKPILCSLPDFETLKTDNITSEANAINALIAGNILDNFLNTDDNDHTVETFNGRMGTGNFDFRVSCESNRKAHIKVRGAQLEIDGGFENKDSIIIMEAKNILNDDFHIRQLYYPYRKYKAFVKKPIRLVFSQYTNMTYYLYEYEFDDPEDYNSLKVVQRAAYTFEDQRITASELEKLRQKTHISTSDDKSTTKIPFIQADRFDRIISLIEHMVGAEDNAMTTDEITQFMGTVQRQAGYYPAAGEYLGLFDRSNRGTTTLSPRAKKIMKLGRRDRQLAFAELMFEHEIFNRLFHQAFKTGKIPDLVNVVSLMRELNVCNPGSSTELRRARTVISWLQWLMFIADESC